MTAEDLLDRLLAAWGAVRSERVARLIERVDRVIGPRTEEGAVDAARIQQLAATPPDPRIASAMVGLVERPLDEWGTLDSVDVWIELANALRHHGGPVHARALADLSSRRPVHRGLANLLAEVRTSLGATEPHVPEEHAALCAEIDAELAAFDPASDARLPPLLAAIYADPSDRAARLVYADALLEKGDPRGEFIHLQLARADDAPPTEREAELLHRYGNVWLGRLATGTSALASYELRGGFLWRIKLGAFAPRHDPVLSTVVCVDNPPFGDVAWIAHPVFRALRQVGGLGWESLVKLGNSDLPLAIECVSVGWWPNPYQPVPLAGVALPCLPALRALEIDVLGKDPAQPALFAELLAQPCLSRLERVRISWGASQGDWRAVLEACPSLSRLEVGLGRYSKRRLELART